MSSRQSFLWFPWSRHDDYSFLSDFRSPQWCGWDYQWFSDRHQEPMGWKMNFGIRFALENLQFINKRPAFRHTEREHCADVLIQYYYVIYYVFPLAPAPPIDEQPLITSTKGFVWSFIRPQGACLQMVFAAEEREQTYHYTKNRIPTITKNFETCPYPVGLQCNKRHFF